MYSLGIWLWLCPNTVLDGFVFDRLLNSFFIALALPLLIYLDSNNLVHHREI
jgi:hypothetical protein